MKKTYWVDASAAPKGDGTRQHPFRTISEAAAIAAAGDEVLVQPGIYREAVDPAAGGMQVAPICYRSVVPRGAVITGAERMTGWEPISGDVWQLRVPDSLFGDYNPYTTVLSGDWFYSEGSLHTGEVYLNGKSLYEVPTLADVEAAQVQEASWEPECSVYQWCCAHADEETILYANFHGADPNAENVEINVRRNCFYPSKNGISYITVSGFVIRQAATTWAPPTALQEGMIGPHWSRGWVIENCEISDSKCSGISLGKYLQPENENKWSRFRLKHGTQTERDAICQAQNEGWSKETIGSHTIRDCDIHDCGQCGIVGHLGCVFSTIENNHIYRINVKKQLIGAEIAGIKLHAAIDVTLKGNHIHDCTRGIWLDWQAQGTRVTGNCLHRNITPKGKKISGLGLGEDLFIEVSHGPTLVDNNMMLSPCAVRLSTQGTAFVHNLIAGSFTAVGEGSDNGGPNTGTRYTPYHVPHRTEIAGFMSILHGDDRFYNNIFVQQELSEDFRDRLNEWCAENGRKQKPVNLTVGTQPFDPYPLAEEYFPRFFREGDTGAHEDRSKYYDALPVYTGGNVFVNGAVCSAKEKDALVPDEKISFEIDDQGSRVTLKTNLYSLLAGHRCMPISTQTLGEAFEPEQKFENPDGSPITFDRDYFGNFRTSILPGPFAAGEEVYCVTAKE